MSKMKVFLSRQKPRFLYQAGVGLVEILIALGLLGFVAVSVGIWASQHRVSLLKVEGSSDCVGVAQNLLNTFTNNQGTTQIGTMVVRYPVGATIPPFSGPPYGSTQYPTDAFSILTPPPQLTAAKGAVILWDPTFTSQVAPSGGPSVPGQYSLYQNIDNLVSQAMLMYNQSGSTVCAGPDGALVANQLSQGAPLTLSSIPIKWAGFFQSLASMNIPFNLNGAVAGQPNGIYFQIDRKSVV